MKPHAWGLLPAAMATTFRQLFARAWRTLGPLCMGGQAQLTGTPGLLYRMVLIGAWIVIYYSTSAVSGIWNKALVDGRSGNVSPTILTLLHLAVSMASDYGLMSAGESTNPAAAPGVATKRSSGPGSGRHTPWDILRSFSPIAVFVIAAKLSTYIGYAKASLALSHTAKASEPIFNALVASLLFGERYSPVVYASLVPIALGVTLASVSEWSFNAVGFAWAVLSALLKVLQNIYTKRLFGEQRFTFLEIHLYCGAASLVMLLPFIVVQMATAATTPFAHLPWLALIGCSLLQYVASFASYMVLHLVSHLTFTIVSGGREGGREAGPHAHASSWWWWWW